MQQLNIYTSNRLGVLSRKLTDISGIPLKSPMDDEKIIVQSTGMQRWLSMQIAENQGICANVGFYYPNSFFMNIVEPFGYSGNQPSVFSPETFTWRIMACLEALVAAPGRPTPIHDYLASGTSTLKAYQLSVRIADLFDQYLLFRPGMMEKWEAGEDDGWQARLWRLAVRGHESEHRLFLYRKFREDLLSGRIETSELPERVSIFGISALPEFYMDFFLTLSGFCEVNLFLLNPCRHYWGDIRTDMEIRKVKNRLLKAKISEDDLYMERGNTLLASLGKVGREFFDLLTAYDAGGDEDFETPAGNTLLSHVQADMLDLVDITEKGYEKRTIRPDDASVRIHSCHSAMREVEVLQNALLKLFEDDPDLSAKDVIVLATDIETYAPYIHAVFDLPSGHELRIPYSVADRSVRSESRVAETFVRILDFTGSRAAASQVVEILENEYVTARFGLTGDDLDIISGWINETRIRWGADGEHSGASCGPEFEENTWEAGIKRLLAGYAMAPGKDGVFADILPYYDVEGGNAGVLGCFISFVRTLFYFEDALGKERTAEEWQKILTDILEAFFRADDSADREMNAIYGAVSAMAENCLSAGLTGRLGLDVVRAHLTQCLENDGFGFGFMTGGVTFCAMLPMRSIPFKVIAILGMDGDLYPRQTKPLGFDLMAMKPEKGDRSRRLDDRYLFLEILISCRKHLHISYTGQSIRDNSEKPPCVIVSELLDYISEGFDIAGGDIRELIFTGHPLHSFSRKYFLGEERFFNYSENDYNTALAGADAAGTRPPFFPNPLCPKEAETVHPDIDELIFFFLNPCRFLLEKRVGIRLGRKSGMIGDREPFSVSGLEKYSIDAELAGYYLEDPDRGSRYDIFRRQGRLPHGDYGKHVFAVMEDGVRDFTGKITGHRGGKLLEPLEIEIALENCAVGGRLKRVHEHHQLQFRYAELKAKDYLSMWIRHLALNACGSGGYPERSMLFGLERGKAAAWTFGPVHDASDKLAALVEFFREGRCRPLPFFPESSFEFAFRFAEKGWPPEKAIEAAVSKWEGGYLAGENQDPSFDRIFGGMKMPVEGFEALAMAVFEPLLSCREKVKL